MTGRPALHRSTGRPGRVGRHETAIDLHLKQMLVKIEVIRLPCGFDNTCPGYLGSPRLLCIAATGLLLPQSVIPWHKGSLSWCVATIRPQKFRIYPERTSLTQPIAPQSRSWTYALSDKVPWITKISDSKESSTV